MSATGYSVDLRDIKFVLHEQLDLVGAMSAYPRYADLDRDTADSMLEEAARISVERIAPTNGPGDRQGCSLDAEGNVTVPDGFKEIWDELAEGGWLGLSADPEFGGMGMPHLLNAAVLEMMTGANTAFATYPGLARAAANLLMHYSPEDLKGLVVSKLVAGEWGATMCLTEADAGSSVGDNRARATPTGVPGRYTLTGEKVFITGGDHALTSNIVHLVLARTPDAPAGTRGLSIFLVPKFSFDAQGELGARNDVMVTKIEEKTGIHGSCTCVLALGANSPCEGVLLGAEGEGMKIMFHMMNEARIGVGIQGLAGAHAAYQNALAYSKERIQGTSLEDFGKGDAHSVEIIRHPDVRRMLMWQRVHVDTMRSFAYSLAMRLDQAEITEDKNEKRSRMGVVELLTPVLKAHCSDRGFQSTVLAVQVYGGYGYIGEFPVEQHMRDAKIASIYEGTNGIQAMDLLGRKMTKGSGILFMTWVQEANAELDKCEARPELAELVATTRKAVESLGGSAIHLGQLGAGGDLKAVMVHASPFLEQFGIVVLGVHALTQARVALAALDRGDSGEQDTRFYKGKLQNARFYTHQVLPQAVALGRGIRSGDTSCLDEDLFV